MRSDWFGLVSWSVTPVWRGWDVWPQSALGFLMAERDTLDADALRSSHLKSEAVLDYCTVTAAIWNLIRERDEGRGPSLCPINDIVIFSTWILLLLVTISGKTGEKEYVKREGLSVLRLHSVKKPKPKTHWLVHRRLKMLILKQVKLVLVYVLWKLR